MTCWPSRPGRKKTWSMRWSTSFGPGFQRCRGVGGGQGDRVGRAVARGPRVGEDVTQGAQDGRVGGGVQIAHHQDRTRAVERGARSEIGQLPRLGDAVVAVDRRVLEAGRDHRQRSAGMLDAGGQDHRVPVPVARGQREDGLVVQRPSAEDGDAQRDVLLVGVRGHCGIGRLGERRVHAQRFGSSCACVVSLLPQTSCSATTSGLILSIVSRMACWRSRQRGPNRQMLHVMART
jgi:hypothetical protein